MKRLGRPKVEKHLTRSVTIIAEGDQLADEKSDEYRAVIESPGSTHNRRFLSTSTIDRYSHFSKNRRIASIEASRILSWPASICRPLKGIHQALERFALFSILTARRRSENAISRSLRSFCGPARAGLPLCFYGI